MRLMWEIADLQAQLEYAEKTTRESSETCSAQEASLAWTKTQIADLQTEHARIKQQYLDPIQEVVVDLQDFADQC